MKKLLTILLAALMVISLLPLVAANGVDAGIGVVITPEQFAPRVYMDPNTRVVEDDCNEEGQTSDCGDKLVERIENYAFEGETVEWDILVWDKNGVEKISDVYVQVLQDGQNSSFMEANCRLETDTGMHGLSLYEGEELLQWNIDTMRWYECKLTVETPASMHGQYMIKAGAVDVSGLSAEVAEGEYWFFNPTIALGINGGIAFGTVRPGATVKSTTLTIGNAAEAGSGVLLDMYIAGTDFYDPSHSGAMCPDSNVLKLENFKYYASNGAYNTCNNDDIDAECYDSIPYYQTGAGAAPNNNMDEIIEGTPSAYGYNAGNVLSPGAEISINFKLAVPVPCNGGSFSQGQIKIFGEAV